MSSTTGKDPGASPQIRPDTGEAARDEQGRWNPGHSGHPGGRPSTKWIREYLGQLSKPGGQPRKLAVVTALYVTAVDRRHKDHVKAAELLLAYEAGKPVQAVEVSGPGQGPLEHVQNMTSEQQKRRMRQLVEKALGAAQAAAAKAAEEADDEPAGDR
jgi:hypothetical protein